MSEQPIRESVCLTCRVRSFGDVETHHVQCDWLRGPESTSAPATLRDQFAMAALRGLLAGPDGMSMERGAAWCYEIADAMLAAREAK